MAPDLDFQQKLAVAREAQVKSKDIKDGEFPPDPPQGEYVGKLATLRANIASTGNPYLYTAIIISEGEHKGMSARDFITLTQPFLIARARNRVEAHEGYGWPENYLNDEESERQQTFVFHEDLIDTLKAIEEDGPMYRFGFSKDGSFGRIKILEVVGAAPAEATAEAAAEESKEAPASTAAEQTLAARLVLFCGAQGVEVKKEDDAETIVEVLKDYNFWSTRVTQKQLNDAGLSDYTPDKGISEVDVALLTEAGLESEIIMPAKKKGPPKRKAK